MTFKLNLVAVAFSLLFVLPTAQAAVQTYSFSGTLDSGYYVGEQFAGNFSFDDSALTAIGEEWLVVDSLSMMIRGNAYTLSDADAPAEIGFVDGAFLGLSYSVSSSEPQFSFIPATFGVGEASIAYDTSNGIPGAGNVTYAPIPEPKGWLQILAGLGLVGVMVERAKRRAV